MPERNAGPIPEAQDEVDVLIVGAGFCGVYLLKTLRERGFRVRLFDAGSELGGIWHWNCYPGARVDSSCYVYQFPWEEIWREWEWSELFPGWEEMRAYFEFVDKKLDLSPDVRLNTWVESAQFDESSDRWVVRATHPEQPRMELRATYLLMCTGIASKTYVPPLEGLETFKGPCHHTGHWPQEGLSFKGKRVGVVGTGASGVQVAQEAALEAERLTVFQRTPVMAIPMRQKRFTAADHERLRGEFPETLEFRRRSFGGMEYNIADKAGHEETPAQREARYEGLWQEGGMRFWLATYYDMLQNPEINRTAYDFWRRKVHERVNDPAVAEKLAPETPPHPFGVKRVSLEQWYFDLFNRDNVDLVDVNETPIVRVTPTGIETADGSVDLDILVLATGFDAVTGGLTQIDIRGTDGRTFAEKWATGVGTYQGMTSTGFPNLFFTYGPQAPTAFLNGPSSAELQGDYIADCLTHLRDKGLSRIEPTQPAEDAWRAECLDLAADSLMGQAKSWYMGANIPGKPIEILFYVGGSPTYMEKLRTSAAHGYEGYTLG